MSLHFKTIPLQPRKHRKDCYNHRDNKLNYK